MNNNITVGFDRTTPSPVNATIQSSVDPTGGTPAHQVLGGLMFAGVNGNKTYQGNPPKAKYSPRVGAVYSLSSKTVSGARSEEHTSELQSPCNLVCRLLLEKKKKKNNNRYSLVRKIT